MTQTEDQKQFVLLVGELKKQMDAQVKLSAIGALGIVLLGTAAFMIWRKR
jgi:hypothetical protein